MKLVIISDTHGMHRDMGKIPDGDVLIHAGDMTNVGELQQVDDFNSWLWTLPHKNKIVIAGNHDWCFERDRARAEKMLTNCTYLQDDYTVIDGVKFWGGPWQPEFCNWAFNAKRRKLREQWDLIPDDTDVLITHGPPFGVLDKTLIGSANVGCEELEFALRRVKPKVHIFGHIHEDFGMVERKGITYVNGSTCDFRYRPINEPIVVEVESYGKA